MSMPEWTNISALSLAVIAGSALALGAAPTAQAGFYVTPGSAGGIPIGPPPATPGKDQSPSIWDDADPDPEDLDPRGHIDIPEIDREPPPPPPSMIFLPPPPTGDDGDIFSDTDGGFDIDLGRKDIPLALGSDGGPTFVPGPTGSSIPAPGTIGLIGLGLLTAARRRRS